MGYQESFICSISGDNTDIEKALLLTKKYNINNISNTSIVGIAKVKKDFSNNHKKKYPILNWPKGTKLLFVSGERYDQRSISRIFLLDGENPQDPTFTDEEREFILSNLDIVFIDDYIVPKLSSAFLDYFESVK
jgi:hypothetical protein